MELFTTTIYFYRKLNSINQFYIYSNIKINKELKKLVVVVLVGTVEFLKLIPIQHCLRTQKHVKKNFYLLSSFLFI